MISVEYGRNIWVNFKWQKRRLDLKKHTHIIFLGKCHIYGLPSWCSGFYKKKKILLPMQETQEMWMGSWVGKIPGEEITIRLSILAWEIPWIDRGAQWATVHGIAKSST